MRQVLTVSKTELLKRGSAGKENSGNEKGDLDRSGRRSCHGRIPAYRLTVILPSILLPLWALPAKVFSSQDLLSKYSGIRS